MKLKSMMCIGTAVLAGSMLLSCTQSALKQNVLTEEEIAQGWTLLFDGETMNGWRDFNGEALTGPWSVEDGTIKAEGGGADSHGYIVTDKEYGNFELSVDWKISKGGNSGILYHVVEGPEYAVPYVTGPEYQLIDDVNYATVNNEPELEPWQRCCVDYAMYLPDFDAIPVNPAGEWNTSKIVFDNGHVVYYINGAVAVEFDAWSEDWLARKAAGKWADAPDYGMAKKGVFCLQDHGYPAWFRNIKVRELPAK